MRLRVIYKREKVAGYLWRDSRGYHFEYSDEYLDDTANPAISVNLPLTQKRYLSDTLFANFQSMLSEGYNREVICRSLGIDPDDEWGLLVHTCGNETIGAITVEREEE